MSVLADRSLVFIHAIEGHHQGFEGKEEDVARLSPLLYKHINFQGRYSFALSESVAQGRFVRSGIPMTRMRSMHFPGFRSIADTVAQFTKPAFLAGGSHEKTKSPGHPEALGNSIHCYTNPYLLTRRAPARAKATPT